MAMSGRPPLEGVRVLDFSRVIAGPLCTMQLADLGAEVIKIENPDGGDDTRQMKPPEMAGEAAFYLAFNRNKRSVALDIRKPEAQEVIHDLLANCDVLVQNFRVGVMKRFGLDYDSLKARYPKLIYLSISAYGQTGPLSDRPGFDPVLQGEAGLMSITGQADGPPTRHPISIIDTYTATYSASAVNAALYARRDTGLGQHIDIALMDVALSVLGNAGMGYLASGDTPGRFGNEHPTATPTNLFETADHPIYIATSTNRLFGQLCLALDLPELKEDARFSSAAERFRNRDALTRILSEAFRTRPRAEWLERMRHLPAGAVRTVGEALESEEAAFRRMVVTVDHPAAGAIRVLGTPYNLSDTPCADPTAPPLLGADTEAVLREFAGYDDIRLQALKTSGALG